MPKINLPTGAEKERFVREMFDNISPAYDRLNRIMTFKIDQVWRKHSLRRLDLPSKSLILDLACGTGDFIKLSRSQGYECIGTDFSMGMLTHANLTNGLVAADGLNLCFKNESFNAVTCGFALRNFRELLPVFQEIHRILAPGGKTALLEVAQPKSKAFKVAHALYFNRIVPIIGAVLSDSNAYRYLPESVNYLPTTSAIVDMMRSAGFSEVEHELLVTGAAQLFIGTKAE